MHHIALLLQFALLNNYYFVQIQALTISSQLPQESLTGASLTSHTSHPTTVQHYSQNIGVQPTMTSFPQHLLKDLPDWVQILLGTLCFIGALQSLVYTFIVAVKTISSKRLHESAISRWNTYARKTMFMLLFVCIRASLAVPTLIIIADWISFFSADILRTILQIYLWIFAGVFATTTLMHTITHLMAAPSTLYYIPDQNMMAEARNRAPDTTVPDIYVILTVMPQPISTFNRTLKSIIRTDYPGQRLFVIALFHPRAKPGLNTRLLHVLGVHAMAPERPYAARINTNAHLICFWSRAKHHRDMQRQGLFLIQSQSRHDPSRLSKSVVVLTDGTGVFSPDFLRRGASSLTKAPASCMAMSGFNASTSYEDWETRQNRSLLVDSDATYQALFPSVFKSVTDGCMSLSPSAVFIRFLAFKAIERSYFASSVSYTVRDLHLMYADWTKYLSTVLMERFGQGCIGFGFLLQPLVLGDCGEHADGSLVQQFWSLVANQTSYLVSTPHLVTSPIVAIEVAWELCTAQVSVVFATVVVLCMVVGVMPLIPLLSLPAAFGIKILLTAVWCAVRGRLALGLFSALYLSLVRPMISLCVMIASFLTWTVRFDQYEKIQTEIVPIPVSNKLKDSKLTIAPTLTRTSCNQFSALKPRSNGEVRSDCTTSQKLVHPPQNETLPCLAHNDTLKRQPIHRNIPSTHRFMLQDVYNGTNSSVLVSHNTDSPLLPQRAAGVSSNMLIGRDRAVGMSLRPSAGVASPLCMSGISVVSIPDAAEAASSSAISAAKASNHTVYGKPQDSNSTLCVRADGNTVPISTINKPAYNTANRDITNAVTKPTSSALLQTDHNPYAYTSVLQPRLFAPINRELTLDVPPDRWRQLQSKPVTTQSVASDWRNAVWIGGTASHR
ncbi:hypothetical protein QVD99_004189 [Batrachochytrium dendrobatidis]|nr:hypothetical protein QVD99_004189 [Batrachochytrium dendrobatidis]